MAALVVSAVSRKLSTPVSWSQRARRPYSLHLKSGFFGICPPGDLVNRLTVRGLWGLAQGMHGILSGLTMSDERPHSLAAR